MRSAISPRRLAGSANRARRVARRAERDSFRHVIMPAAWTFGAVGAAILLVTCLLRFAAGGDSHLATGFGLGLVALPVVLFLYRILRCHFCTALDEP